MLIVCISLSIATPKCFGEDRSDPTPHLIFQVVEGELIAPEYLLYPTDTLTWRSRWSGAQIKFESNGDFRFHFSSEGPHAWDRNDQFVFHIDRFGKYKNDYGLQDTRYPPKLGDWLSSFGGVDSLGRFWFWVHDLQPKDKRWYPDYLKWCMESTDGRDLQMHLVALDSSGRIVKDIKPSISDYGRDTKYTFGRHIRDSLSIPDSVLFVAKDGIFTLQMIGDSALRLSSVSYGGSVFDLDGRVVGRSDLTRYDSFGNGYDVIRQDIGGVDAGNWIWIPAGKLGSDSRKEGRVLFDSALIAAGNLIYRFEWVNCNRNGLVLFSGYGRYNESTPCGESGSNGYEYAVVDGRDGSLREYRAFDWFSNESHLSQISNVKIGDDDCLYIFAKEQYPILSWKTEQVPNPFGGAMYSDIKVPVGGKKYFRIYRLALKPAKGQ